MKDDFENEGASLKDGDGTSQASTAQPKGHGQDVQQMPGPPPDVLATDNTEIQNTAASSDHVTVASHEHLETVTKPVGLGTNTTAGQDPERNEAGANPSPTISLLCRPDPWGRACHSCTWLGGAKYCRDCGQDLSKLAIFETLAPTSNLARDDGKAGGGQTHNLPGNKSKSSGILFCRKGGLCHVCMMNHGWARCSFCELDFSMLLAFCTVPDKKDDVGSDKSSGKEDVIVADKPEGRDSQGIISHSVEYIGMTGISLGSVPWSEPFDLTRARLGALKNTNDSAAFEIITQVNTSIESFTDFQYKSLPKGVHSIMETKDINLSVRTTVIRILSMEIIKDISGVVSYYPSVQLGGRELVLEEPYDIIAHHLQPLESIQKSNEHTKKFLETVKESMFKTRIQEERARNKKGLCTFPMLWLLFKPGDTVYAERDGDLFALVVIAVLSPKGVFSSPKLTNRRYVIEAWNLEFDGRYVGRCKRGLFIESFEGERIISTLKVVPCQFIDDQDNGATRERLQRLGRQWYEMLPGRSILYSGPVKTLPGKEKQVRLHHSIPSASVGGRLT